MPVDRTLGKKCRYAEKCTKFQGIGIPDNMTRTIWRNVFCYRGRRGGAIVANTWYSRKKSYLMIPSIHELNNHRMKSVYLREIENPKEKEILKLLKVKGECLYGDIIKQLAISATEGQRIIFSLLKRGLIRFQSRTSNIELNVDLK